MITNFNLMRTTFAAEFFLDIKKESFDKISISSNKISKDEKLVISDFSKFVENFPLVSEIYKPSFRVK
jgi:hypothetical protein